MSNSLEVLDSIKELNISATESNPQQNSNPPKPKDKKKKPPKPGSKAAQLLKSKPVKGFTKPTAYVNDSVLILYFATAQDLKDALMNVHLFYEKQELNGPLKGVNFPIGVYYEWMGTISDYTEGELYMKSLTANIQANYLIAGLKGDQSTFLHEWAHAVYFANSDYREMISKIYSGLDQNIRTVIEKELQQRNYHPNAYEDEFQAYVRENPADFGKKYSAYLSEIHQQLKKHVALPKLANPIDTAF
ncbi:hypothetical protein HDV01_004045 [Terramyces sp. JEL0728]|nr:hypothetical protein HDV01_004045 [Terramyces sp. JEL0728]